MSQLDEIGHPYPFNEFRHFTSVPTNTYQFFNHFKYLERITMPPHITKIEGLAFCQDRAMYGNGYENSFKSLTLTIGGITKSTTSGTIEYSTGSAWKIYPNLYIYVPDEYVEQYKADSSWEKYVNRIKPISEYPD